MKIEFTHVKFEGDGEGARSVLSSLAEMFGRSSTTNTLPAPEPLPELPAPAEQPVLATTMPPPGMRFTTSSTAHPVPIARERTPRTREPRAAKPVAAPPAKVGGQGNKLVMICREKPGRFTVVEAAKLAGVSVQRVHQARHEAKKAKREWALVGEFQFKATPSSSDASAEDRHEARSRHDGTSEPINPMRLPASDGPAVT